MQSNSRVRNSRNEWNGRRAIVVALKRDGELSRVELIVDEVMWDCTVLYCSVMVRLDV